MVARSLAARTALASSESRVVVGAVGDALVETVEEAAAQGFLRSRFGGRALRRRCAHGPGKG